VRPSRLIALIALAALATSCAYYNPFYLARKYYFRGTGGLPYAIAKPLPTAATDFNKSIELSKRVMANYPKSKWVDHAYLLWARALLGREDPRETVNMLQDFGVRFPTSKIRSEALFYLGVAYRLSHRYGEAEASLEQFLTQQPKHDLAPYAWLERSRALTSLDRDSAAAFCAGQVLERFPKSRLGPEALAARAEALLQAGDYPRARLDYQALGDQASDDEQRLTFLFKEADCLEAARDYEPEMALLKGALGHEQPPPETATTPGAAPAPAGPQGTAGDRYGRLLVRTGTVNLLAGRQKDALDDYGQVVHLYPKTQLGAEAQYRIGYTYEAAGDDFARARDEYARVVEESPGSAFATQAQGRLANLDRVMQYRTAGGDTLRKRAEEGFLLAELYLFQLGKPERALEEYGKVAAALPGTPWAAKALDAQAWVLSRKLGRTAEAESLFWVVVHQYPATEAQLAARDYLERGGASVPDSLIRMPLEPEPQFAPADTANLTPPPEGTPRLGALASADLPGRNGSPAAPRRGFMHVTGAPRPLWDPRFTGTLGGEPSLAGDSPFTGAAAWDDSSAAPVELPRDMPPARSVVPDSLRERIVRHPEPGRIPAPPDTTTLPPGLRRLAPADSARLER
jgi:tetratricopeptide (TPR) repeat protein